MNVNISRDDPCTVFYVSVSERNHFILLHFVTYHYQINSTDVKSRNKKCIKQAINVAANVFFIIKRTYKTISYLAHSKEII